ncbi:MAG: PAS domain-containing protein [Opitutaceae bacterium]|nr:PAS domain-containing protein [Opitutaceae bacterium]
MPLETPLRRYTSLAAGCALLLGGLTLLGWAIDAPALRTLFLGGRPMSLNSALCFTCYGAALLLLAQSTARPAVLAGRALAALPLGFALGAWLEYATGRSFGIDRFFFPPEPSLVPTMMRGPVPLNTMIPVVLLGLGLLAVKPTGRSRYSLSTWFGLAVLAVSLLTLVSHLLALAGAGKAPGMSGTSALALLALGSGLAGVRANRDFLRIIAPGHPLSRIVRRVLLLGLLAPVLLYLAQVWLLLDGLPELQEDVTLVTSAFGVGLLGALTYFLRRLHALDEQRATAEQARDSLFARLEQQAANLQYEVAARTQELRTLHERLQFAVGSAGFGLWEYDFLERRLQWDDRLLDIYGLPREEFRGRLDDWQRLVHPSDLGRAAQSSADVLAGRVNHYQAEFRIIRPDGGVRHIRALGYLQRDPDGKAARMVGLDQDITRDRRHESELAELNERLQLALRAEGGGVWDLELHSGRLRWDARQCEIYGVRPDEFDGRLETWRRFVHPEDLAGLASYADHPSASGDYVDDRFRIVRPDGAVRHISTVGYVYRDTTGQAMRIVGLDRDVTAEVETRDKLRVAEERLALALKASGEGMWDWNVPGGHVYFSPRWMEMIGYSPDELPATSATWEGLIHPDDRPAALAALHDHFAGRTPVYTSEHRLRTRDGGWIWTLSRGEVVARGPQGEPLRVVGMQGDITERKVLEQQLRRNQEIALQVGRLAHIGGWEVDMASQRITWAPEVYRIHEVELGYTPTIQNALAFYPPEARAVLQEAMARAERDGTPFDLELPFVTARNRRLRVRTIGRAEMQQGHAVRLFGAFQDITTRYEAEQERHRLETQLFQAQKMETLGTLAGGIAHDFNNLLTGIMGYQDLALDGLPTEHEAHHCIVAAREASFRARGLVDQILAFSRPAADTEQIPMDLATVVEEARRFLRATVPVTIQIQTEIAPHCGRVKADATQMHQVLLNLGSNAAHAMRNGGGILRIALTPVRLGAAEAAALGGLAAGRHLQLSISDTGHGIDPETIKRIFDPFFTTKNVGEGTGLGLSVVHGIVRAHRGAIQVRSALGEGARFDIYLPESEAADARPDDAAGPLTRGRGEVVCIVDDEEVVATFTRTALTRLGYQAIHFDSGTKCLQALQHDAASCSVLITDQTMPGMTGMELAAQVRTFAPRLPIIVMSGYFSKISPSALDQIGHITLLAKPFTIAEITRAVHRAIHPE